MATSASTAPEPSARLRTARMACALLPPLGAQRLRDVIYPRSAAREDDWAFTVRAATGSPFSGRTSDFVGYPMAVHGYFNWRNVAIAGAVCRPGDVIVEVGANIGTETVSFSDVVGANGQVYAFEPFAPNLTVLERNAAQTKHRNVRVMPIALSDHAGEVSFAAPPRENSGVGHLLAGNETPDEASVVSTRTLDSLLGEMGTPRLVVIDAEGHEGAIVAGAREFLRALRPVVVLEVIDELLARSGSSPELIAEWLEELAYDVLRIERLSLQPIRARGPIPRASDWIAVPRPSGDSVRRVERMLKRCGLLPCVTGLNPLKRR
ncbi:MAG TPA: FkbM family methyltransferase [Solirubrobacteraceae bacterium]